MEEKVLRLTSGSGTKKHGAESDGAEKSESDNPGGATGKPGGKPTGKPGRWLRHPSAVRRPSFWHL